MEAFLLNPVGILVAVIASIVVGSLWYGPLFGKPWMALMGYTPERLAAMKNDPKAKSAMMKSYLGQLVGSFFMAYVLSHVMVYAASYMEQPVTLMTGLSSAFWMWLGFVMPVQLGSVLWEQKPMKLFWINTSHYLVLLGVMSAIMGFWGK